MLEFKADLHIHTVLSPCGGLDMSPANIVDYAARKGLDIIGITDHNTTRHCSLIQELGKEKGIFVIGGAELNTREEIHCLALFETFAELTEFQNYIDKWLPYIKNDPVRMGDQVQVNRKDEIVYVEERSLYSSLDQSIDEVEIKVHELNGIFIPAHVDRPRNSIYSQLGFFPQRLFADAIEISKASDPVKFISDHDELRKYTILRSSDAHYPKDIARMFSIFRIRNRSFEEIRLALKKAAGREVFSL